jgi:hypothetical protein
LIGSALAAVVAAGSVTNACSREQNLVDDYDPGVGIGATPTCDGGIPEVPDAGLDHEALTACAERPVGNCQGANDFPCEFEAWVREVVSACQERAECRAGGCIEAQMGDDGCVTSVHMTEPDPLFVECVVESFGAYRCPCGATSARRYLGPSTGCHRLCATGERICPDGDRCIEGICRPAGAGGAG